jgi:hypothetical protein
MKKKFILIVNFRFKWTKVSGNDCIYADTFTYVLCWIPNFSFEMPGSFLILGISGVRGQGQAAKLNRNTVEQSNGERSVEFNRYLYQLRVLYCT